MKIEKIAENKIRIILNKDDFKNKNIDLHTIMSRAAESQGLLLMLLNKAQKEVDFNTDGYRLLIEGFSSSDDVFVFTITKYLDTTSSINPKSKLIVKRKCFPTISSNLMYKFNDFEEFCDFCNLINSSKSTNLKNFFSSSALYLYNNLYYLIIHNVHTENIKFKKLYSEISEFAKQISYSPNFENKLKEHGKIIIKKNAITTGIKYFSSII